MESEEKKLRCAAHSTDAKRPKTHQKRVENRRKKTRSMSELARDTTLSIKCGLSPLSVSIDLDTFTTGFFKEKHLPEYSRLNPLSKLLVCQYVLHTQLDNSLKPRPFVFRLPTELHSSNGSELNEKIQRKLSSELGRPPLFWTARENDGGLSKTITHLNGEILLYPGELKKCEQALVKLFRSFAPNTALNKGIQATDGTITAKPLPAYAIISFAKTMASRKRWTAKLGEFYTVFNWPGYATKKELERNRERKIDAILKKQPNNDKEKFHYISGELNRLATKFYIENIRKHQKSKS